MNSYYLNTKDEMLLHVLNAPISMLLIGDGYCVDITRHKTRHDIPTAEIIAEERISIRSIKNGVVTADPVIFPSVSKTKDVCSVIICNITSQKLIAYFDTVQGLSFNPNEATSEFNFNNGEMLWL